MHFQIARERRNNMTGKERLANVIARLKVKGVTDIKPILDADKARTMTLDEVYESVAIFLEAIESGKGRVAKKFGDSYGLKD